MERWSESELTLLKEKYDESYSYLLKLFPGRSLRALKHKIGDKNFGLGLVRGERRRWSEQELVTLKESPGLSAKELSVKLGRSDVSVAQQLRVVRGSANRRFKGGWEIPSEEFAYLLGAFAADGTIGKYKFEFSQVVSNEEFVERVKIALKDVFGIEPVKYVRGRFVNVVVCSDEFSRNIGGKKNGSWLYLVEKFPWISEERFFWYFISGLYDGDGCLSRSKRNFGIWYDVKQAVKDEVSRRWFCEEMMRRGFDFAENSWDKNGVCCDVRLRGGQQKVDEFLMKLHSSIPYKRSKGQVWR